jgi:O-antigen/teichoic acid export membrane protein
MNNARSAKMASKLRSDATILVGGEGLRRGVMALAGILAFRVLPLAEMGVLSVAVSIASALRFFCAGGIPLVVRRDMVLDSERARALWNSSIFLVGVSSLICLVGSPLVLLGLRAESMFLVFVMVLLHHVLGAYTDTYNALLIAKSRAKASTIVDVTVAISLLAFTCIAWALGLKSAFPYALAYTLAGLFGISFAYGYAQKYRGFRMPERRDLSATLRQSVPFAIDAIVITAYFRLSVAGVYWLAGEAPSALYAIGQSFAFLIGMVPARIAMAALPKIVVAAQTSAEALAGSVKQLWRYFIPMGVLIVGGSVLTCQWWLPLVLGQKGNAAVIHCVLIGLSRFPVFISTPATFALDAMRLQKMRAMISFLVGISLAVLGIPLTMMYGATGMSIALLVVETVGAAAYVAMYCAKIRVWKPILDQKKSDCGNNELIGKRILCIAGEQ